MKQKHYEYKSSNNYHRLPLKIELLVLNRPKRVERGHCREDCHHRSVVHCMIFEWMYGNLETEIDNKEDRWEDVFI